MARPQGGSLKAVINYDCHPWSRETFRNIAYVKKRLEQGARNKVIAGEMGVVPSTISKLIALHLPEYSRRTQISRRRLNRNERLTRQVAELSQLLDRAHAKLKTSDPDLAAEIATTLAASDAFLRPIVAA